MGSYGNLTRDGFRLYQVKIRFLLKKTDEKNTLFETAFRFFERKGFTTGPWAVAPRGFDRHILVQDLQRRALTAASYHPLVSFSFPFHIGIINPCIRPILGEQEAQQHPPPHPWREKRRSRIPTHLLLLLLFLA